MQYNELYDLSTKSETLNKTLMNVLRAAGEVYKGPLNFQAREIIRMLFQQVGDAFESSVKSYEDKKSLIQKEDYDRFNTSRIQINDYIHEIGDNLKNAKYEEAATDISRLQDALISNTSIIKQRLGTIGNGLILAKP